MFDPNFWTETLGLGSEPKELTSLQISLRAIIVFISAVIMVRLADKRFLSRKTAYDAVLGFVMASMLARAINGSAPLVPTLVGGFVLVFLHRGAAWASRHAHWFGWLMKGRSDVIIENGQIIEEGMRKNLFSRGDLDEDLRLQGVERVEDVKSAHVERNGTVSVIKN
ncbi:MAG: DUF421 domain-containing protein [Verrucomicrobiales bacterium]